MTDLATFPDGFRALIVGASGGVGEALTTQLVDHPRCAQVFAASRSGKAVAGAQALSLDFEDPQSVEAAVEAAAEAGPLHLVIVASGVLVDGEGRGPEKSWRQIDAAYMTEVFKVNTIGPALVARSALDKLARGQKDAPQKAVFAALSARVGSISDNRLGGWHSYRASKAALNQILKTCAIELARKRPHAVCMGLHPGTVDTALSSPFQGNVPDGKLFTPDYSEARLLDVVDQVTADQSGCVFDWAGKIIDP
ncbi:SDR family NAD(P)-dependent oxidoreductase [Oceanicaulis alexandrii]|uniref:SDR family NAD(P)-dependent oxidoreductase n=1 Tax=Oceanicaulis alexandrii TaxID=153233 RepID=UPI00235451C0|nr:SDR family NAD(P)-dependent oxidoreductase [Oceanicaulis alexandrii]